MSSATKIGVGVFGAGLLLWFIYSVSKDNERLEEQRAELEVLSAVRSPQYVGWRYSEEKDEMRGTITKKAEVLSDDELLRPTLRLWYRSNGEMGVQLISDTMDRVGVECPYSTNSIAVKGDAGPVQNFRCQYDGSIVIEPAFIGLVKKSDKLMIEAPGAFGVVRQFTFRTADLKLEAPAS